MASVNPSTHFLHLANAWRLLSLRNDTDDIILELLGRFSLERIYAESNTEKFQQLVGSLIAQLNIVIYIQRLSLPPEREQATCHLGILATWEIIVRSLEFTLQVILEGRESLWGAHSLLDKQLPNYVSTALRVISLHPKEPSSNQERHDRLSRIHSLLERFLDGYPGRRSFLLLICRDIADGLLRDPGDLALPAKLRYELPNLESDLYPLHECLSDRYIFSVMGRDSNRNWLAQFLTFRDITQFVIGASIQYAVHGETRDVSLPACSAKTRNAILTSLDKLRMPSYISKMELLTMFSESFRIVLPDTLSATSRAPSDALYDSSAVEALKTFCLSLSQRQVVHRASDGQVMRAVSSIVRNLSLLDDPSGRTSSAHPRAYAVNCKACHIVGETQFRSFDFLEFPDPDMGTEISLPSNTKCVQCRQTITLAREIPLVRESWEALSSIEFNADPINVERHVSSSFKLLPPKSRGQAPMSFAPGYSFYSDAGDQISPETASYSHLAPHLGHNTLPSPVFLHKSPSVEHGVLSPVSPAQVTGHHITGYDSSSHNQLPFRTTQRPASPEVDRTRPIPIQNINRTKSFSRQIPFFRGITPSQATETTASSTTSPSQPESMPAGKGMSRWISKLGGSKKDIHPSTTADTDSLSSNTLEAQKPEEISLQGLKTPKTNLKTKAPKFINVDISQNSSHVLFWTPLYIYVWDAGVSPAVCIAAIPTDGHCLLAAVTKTYLAYIVGGRDQKLLLQIVNLRRLENPPLEYRMSSSQWCKSIAICPRGNYVVVGFENAIVRFFKITDPEPQGEFRLHHRYHAECNSCPSVDTLSFSTDGYVLLASTRNGKTGVIQIYQWKFPYLAFQELSNCHYHVPLHESEDNGVSSAIYRSDSGEEDLICITTWTQSGAPVLIQPEDGHKIEIKNDGSNRRLGNRIQCAAFSLSGELLAMVNNKGFLYLISNLNSSIMKTQRTAVSKELTAKSNSFAMSFMMLHDEETIVLAWADSNKSTGYIKKVPVPFSSAAAPPAPPASTHIPPELPGDTVTATRVNAIRSHRMGTENVQEASGDGGGIPFPRQYARPEDIKVPVKRPVELAATDGLVSANRLG